jgi:hypothetical protein
MRLGLLLASLLFSWSAQAKTLYILGVDGLSYEAFQAAQQKGLLKDFKSVAAHIAPFPTMTDLSWAEMMKTEQVFGAVGRIRTVEAVYFDESRKSVEGDVRDYYNRLARPKYYLNAFQHVFNPYVEGLMYFPTKELPKLEIGSVVSAMRETQNQPIVTGYVGAVDSLAHTQFEQLFPAIQILDAELRALIQQKRESKEDFEIVLVSDHGNIGRFQEGAAEKELTPVEIEPVLKKAGLRFVQKLEQDSDVAMPLLALGSWAPAYFQNRSKIPAFVNELIRHDWFDLAIELIERSKARTIVKVTGAKGVARVHFVKATKSYFYEVLQGNPLEIPATMISSASQMKPLSEAMIEAATRNGNYPDSLIRLIGAGQSPDFDFPDLVLSIKDGFYLNNALGKMTKMYRTHGSLTRASSLGIVASTGRQLPAYIRSERILSALGVAPEILFGSVAHQHKKNPLAVIQEAKKKNAIATGAKDFSQKRIFQQMSKVIADSRPYFVADEIKSFLSAFNFSLPSVTVEDNGVNPMAIAGFDPSKLDAKTLVDPKEIGELTDMIIRNPDPQKLVNDPKIASLKKKFGMQESAAPFNPEEHKGKIIGVKRAAMKLYQIPALLDQSLVVQEKAALPETRDLDFAEYWEKNRSSLNTRPEGLQKVAGQWKFWKKNTNPTVAERLFKEVFKETQLEDRVAPQVMDSVYKRIPRATLVYVPGTYNGIFDREIFSLGLLSLQEDLGVRVLKAPVLSACSSEVNGAALLKFLKEDQQRFLERKEEAPKYILIGYSKGGNDSLAAFIQDKDFVKNNILGLVALASPLKGSAILEKTDLPFQLVNLLIEEDTPEICKKEKTATSSVTSAAMNKFWRQHERELVGLTRYFSLSFVSTPENSHLFMKATKVIAQFDEENDGIVGLSSSKFPARLMPIDLGVVEADHLAGILSSKFPQKAFLRAIAKTVAEMQVDEPKMTQDWKKLALMRATSGLLDDRYVAVWDSTGTKLRLFDVKSKTPMMAVKEVPFKDPYDVNSLLLPATDDPSLTYDPKVKLPANQLAYDPYQSLDLAKLPDLLSVKKVTPATPQNQSQGIDLSYSHQNFIHYRMDHQWLYESRSPVGADNNPKWGFETVQGPDKTPWLALRSEKNSIRLTTVAYRFKPSDFRKFDLTLKVTKGPVGADPVKGHSGKDDSAFQVWLTLRDLRGVGDRSLGDKSNSKVYLFGYYWGDETPGEKRVAGQLFENYYSNKNVIITTLPVSYQVVLNTGAEKLGQVVSYQRDLVADLKRAYPDLDINQLEVIATTIQMDSNDTSSSTEAFMKTLRFSPASAAELGRLAQPQ